MAIDLYTTLAGQYDPALTNGVNQVVQNGLARNVVVIGEALSLYVIVHGLLMAFGQFRTWHPVVMACMRAAIISLLLTAAYFQTYIQTPFLDTIPTYLAGAVNGTTGVAAGPAQFDLIESAVVHQEAAILQQASGFFNLDIRLEVAAITEGITLLLMVCFIVYEYARGMMGLLICVLVFTLPMYLFRATRSVPERVLGKMVGLLILDLMFSILVQIVIAGMNMFMMKVQGNPGAGLPEMVQTMSDILHYFLFAVAMVLMLPATAAFIGGGVSFNLGPILTLPIRLLRGR